MSLPIRCGAEGQAGLQPRQRVKKSLAEFAARRWQKIKIIFSRDMCVRENTSQAASVEFVRHGRANYARSRLQAFCRKTRRVFRQSRGAEGQIGLQPRVGFTPPSTPLLLQWCWGPRWCRPWWQPPVHCTSPSHQRGSDRQSRQNPDTGCPLPDPFQWHRR